MVFETVSHIRFTGTDQSYNFIEYTQKKVDFNLPRNN